MNLFRYLIKADMDAEEVKRGIITLERAEKTFKRLGISTEGLTKITDESVRMMDRQGRVVGAVSAKFENASKQIATVSYPLGQVSQRMGDFEKAMRRVLIVVPIWFFFRQAFMMVVRTISEGVRYWVDLESAIARASAVTHNAGMEMSRAMDILRQKAEAFAIQHKGTAQDVVEAYYRMGTAGHDFEASLAGAIPITKLAIGTYGNVAEAGRTVAGIYRTLGDRIEGATSKQEKMQRITDVLARTWQTHEIELNELAQAVANVGAQASVFGMGLEETIAVLGVSSDMLIKAGRAGTLFGRSLDDLSKNLSKVEEILGKRFDPSQPIKWFQVFMDVITHFKKLGMETPAIVEQLTSVFQIRAKREVMALVVAYDHLVNSIKDLKTASTGAVDALMAIRDATPEAQIENLRDNINRLIRLFITGAMDTDDFVEALKRLNTQLENSGFLVYGLARGIHDMLTSMRAVFRLGLVGEEFRQKLTKGQIRPGTFKKEWAELQSAIDKAFEGVPTEVPFSADWAKKIAEDFYKAMDELEELSKQRKEEIKQKVTEILGVESEVTEEIKRQLGLLSDLVKYSQMEADGVDKTQIAYQKIVDWIDRWATELELGGEAIDRQKILTEAMVGNWEKIISLTKINKEEQQELVKLQQLIVDYQIEQKRLAREYGEAFRSATKEGFKDLLKQEATFGDFVERLKAKIKDMWAEAITEGLLRKIGTIFPAIGNIFGGIETKIVGASAMSAPLYYNAILTSSQQGAKMFYDAIVRASQQGGGGGFVPSGGYPGGYAPAGYQDVMGAYGGSYQNISGIYSGIKGLWSPTTASTAMGAETLVKPTMMQTAGQVLGTIGIAYMAYQTINSLVQSFKSKTSVTEQTSTMQVASRIDVTNKLLQIANRNLVALRSDIRTYMLPSSAYFAEKRGNIEDEFSIYARRGIS